MSRILIVFALLCAGLSILTFGSYASPNDEHQGANDSSVQQVNLVVQWNRTLLAIVRTPGAQPVTVHPTRSFAILHAAIYDAVNAIDRTRTPYLVQVRRAPRATSQDAAAAAAAHDVLVALYPSLGARLDEQLQQSLAQVPDGAALNEVKSLGIANSTAAPADQALTGRFWNGAIQNYWNEIAQTASVAHHLTTAQSARLFALLNLTLADGVIAFYDAKYTYNFWRPVTAIRAAATDGNPETEADPNWLPEVGNTTPDPSYPGAHAVISAAGAEVLGSFVHNDHFEFSVTSEVLAGADRSFPSFSA